MFSFSAVVVALLLIPTFLSVFVLHLFFPRNTLKISEVQLFPLGIGLSLLSNLNRIPKFLELLTPPVCFEQEYAERVFVENFVAKAPALIELYLRFCIDPLAIFTVATAITYFAYRQWCLDPKSPWPISRLGSLTNDLVVNYMGKMTTYSPKKEALLVDVLDANDSLYSGIFYDYFMEGKRLVGIRISNIIRYSFKAEKDRKGDPNASNLPYLIPNDGQMFFPVSNIQNLHFWKLKSSQKEILSLDSADKQIRFAWLLGLKYSLPHLKLDFKGRLAKDVGDLSHLAKSFNTLHIKSDLLFENVLLNDEDGPN